MRGCALIPVRPVDGGVIIHGSNVPQPNWDGSLLTGQAQVSACPGWCRVMSAGVGWRRLASAGVGTTYLVMRCRRCGGVQRFGEGHPMEAEIKGSTMPVLEVSLRQGEYVVTPHGELAWMTSGIQMSQTMNTGSGGGGFMSGIKRVMGGGGLFLTRYDGPGEICFAAKVP